MSVNRPLIEEYWSEFDKAAENLRWIRTFNQISQYRYLPFNWDGEGETAPSQELVKSLLGYLQYLKGQGQLSAPDRTAVSGDGEIVVEWQFPDCVMELSARSPGVLEIMLSPDVGEPTFLEVEQERHQSDFGVVAVSDFSDVGSAAWTLSTRSSQKLHAA